MGVFMKNLILTIASLATAGATPLTAWAQEAPAPDLTVTGSATLTSQYRLRGVSFSDEKPAIQGSVTVAHKSGFYMGTWASSQAGYGTFGGSNMEVDLLGGFTTTLGKTTLDAGFVWYFFPGTSNHEFSEFFASASHPVGPARAKIGANYALQRDNIGTGDNLYIYGDLSLPLKRTPITLRGHLGYTDGKGSIYGGPRGRYVDYNVGADVAWHNLTLSLSYVGTDIDGPEADAYYTYPGTKSGHQIVDGAALISLTAAF